jgi:uncharacterized Zn-finger protein
MADRERRSYQCSDTYWNGTPHAYASPSDYPSAQYPSNSPTSYLLSYSDDAHSPTSDRNYSHSYYPANGVSYNHSTPSPTGHQSYSSFPSQTSDDSTVIYGQRHSHHRQIHRPQSTHPYHTAYSQSSLQDNAQNLAYPQQYSPPSPGHTRERYYSPPQSYMSQPDSPTHYGSSPPHYPTQIPLSPASATAPHLSGSPTRPFLCDLCTLSFNRQHDLKRHRETHTGEKPYFCNGGCGKTFTRKDALKRHQVSIAITPNSHGLTSGLFSSL